jgi:hypothetical protein
MGAQKKHRPSRPQPSAQEILDNTCVKMGQSESETLRIAFIEYARSISLVTEKVHSRK